MFKYYKIYCLSALFLICLFCGGRMAQSTSLGHISDTISTSVPNVVSSHTIKFFNPSFIPPGGKIIITPEPLIFYVQDLLNYTDVDISVSDTMVENYIDRNVSTSSDAIYDGVSVGTGQNGSITVTLNSSEGIDAGKNVKIEIGPIANFGENGSHGIINPAAEGSKKMTIATYDAANGLLDKSEILIHINKSVKTSNNIEKIRANGKPTMNDILMANTPVIIMSLTTNYRAVCRYVRTINIEDETGTTTSFFAMTDQFANTGAYYHSVFINNPQFGHWRVYVRCYDQHDIADDTSYLIEFRIAAPGEGNEGTGSGDQTEGEGQGGGTGDGEGPSSRPSGGGGGGRGGGTGSEFGREKGTNFPYPPELGQPNVYLKGWSYPLAKMTIYKDGTATGTVNATDKATFEYAFYNLVKGKYTFGVQAKDASGYLSNIVNSVIWVNDGAITTISDIFVPASLVLKNSNINSGDQVEASGLSIPDSKVEVSMFLYTGKNPSEDKIIKKEVIAGKDGKWQANLETTGLAKGLYKVRTRTNLDKIGWSEYSKLVDLGLGVTVKTGLRADLNNDGKVNLIDFSILMYHWNTNHETADVNTDGKVNLIDFSLMMYEWTG